MIFAGNLCVCKLLNLINRLNLSRFAVLNSDYCEKSPIPQFTKKTLKIITFVVDSKEIWHLIKFDFEISTLYITQSNVMFILLSSDAVLFFSVWFEMVSIVGAFYLFHRSHFFGNFSSSFAENFNINTYFAPSVFHVRIRCRASHRIVSWKV